VVHQFNFGLCLKILIDKSPELNAILNWFSLFWVCLYFSGVDGQEYDDEESHSWSSGGEPCTGKVLKLFVLTITGFTVNLEEKVAYI